MRAKDVRSRRHENVEIRKHRSVASVGSRRSETVETVSERHRSVVSGSRRSETVRHGSSENAKNGSVVAETYWGGRLSVWYRLRS